MSASSQEKALVSFYENLARVQRDQNYYLNPVGISRRDTILALIGAQQGDLIGDLGCGEGLISMELRRTMCRIIGCELSPLRARLAVANGIEALGADILQMPYSDTCFDRIICTEVIEHVTSPRAALDEIRRVLRVGGVAVLSVPLNEDLEQTLLDVPDDILADGCYSEIRKHFSLKNSHLTSFTEESFLGLLTECGFQIVDTEFTFDYALKRLCLYKAAIKSYRTVARLGPTSNWSQIAEALVRPLIFASHQKQDTKHHIVVKVEKPRF